MKLLYIHGLDSHPSEEKLALMQEQGHEVSALHIDYRKDKTAYWRLKELALEEKIEFIIGSSLGGYFGYWLGQELGLQQLLFNPAMPFRSVHVPKPSIEPAKEMKSWVVLGVHDEIIPHTLNLDFFRNHLNARVITCSWLGHRIDIETFDEMLRWAGLYKPIVPALKKSEKIISP